MICLHFNNIVALGIKEMQQNGKESSMKKYSSYLKEIYSEIEGKDLDSFKLVVVKMKRVEKKEANEFVKKTLKDSANGVILKKYFAIEENKIAVNGGSSNQPNPRLIIIEGAPGVGKTTFSKDFCYKWSKGQHLKDTLLVLLLLQDNNVRSAKCISDLFFHPHLKQAISKEIENSEGDGVTLWLEGWDELDENKREKSVFLDLINGHVLPKATIVVTSQPWATKVILESSHIEVDQHVEILTTPEIQYKRLEKKYGVDKEKFKQYISSNPILKAAMYTPVTASVVAEIFQWSQDTPPKTMTELYKLYTCKLLTQVPS